MSTDKKKKKHIKILNPVSGSGYTSQKKALWYVRSGQARIVCRNGIEHLEFLAGSVRSARVRECFEKRMSERDLGYDRAAGSGLASIDALRNLPIAGDPMRVLMKRTRRAA